MLYVTTRNFQDPFTTNHPLQEDRGKDGGFWIPYNPPLFSTDSIRALKDQSFNTTVAQVLNHLFGTKLTSWDVDFCIGRYPVRFSEITGRVIIVEPWHNPNWTFDNMVIRLSALIGAKTAGSWIQIAVRTAVLFGCYGEMLRQNLLKAGECMDVSVLSGNFLDPMSVRYARSWGLPVENIICCCNENTSIWNLICHGQMRTDMQAIATCLPEADVSLPVELERMIAASGGNEELEDYLECCRTGKMYIPSDAVLADMRQGLFVSVISSHRIPQTISGVYTSHKYLLSPEGALTYAGLQDYRSKKGQIRLSLVMTKNSPSCNADFVAEAAGIDKEKL